MPVINSKAIYLQLADKIMDGILSGEYPSGERLPSVRDYAASVEVNSNTVMRTYDFLQQRGVISNKRGVGFFVDAEARPTILELRRSQFFNEETPYFFNRLKQFEVSSRELAEMYQNYLKNQQ